MAQCIFCGSNAINKNKQNFPVCKNHKEDELPDLKCACGEYLDVRESKYGPFFTCFNCGAISINKARQFNDFKPKDKPNKIQVRKKPTEITVRSDEVDFI